MDKNTAVDEPNGSAIINSADIKRKLLTKRWLLILFVVVSSVVVITLSATLKGGEEQNLNPPQSTDGSKVYTLLNLGSSTCAPCNEMKPTRAALKEKYEGKINVLYYDIYNSTEGADYANEFDLMYTPTLIFLEDGVEVARMIGLSSQAQIENKFKELGWI